MMILPVTLLTTAALVGWYIFLSVTVSFARGAAQAASATDTDTRQLNRLVRVHGNAAEYIPLFVMVLALLEFHGLRVEVLYVLSGSFVIGRILHRTGLLRGSVVKRIWSMQLTLWPLAIGALILLYTWFSHTFLVG